MIIGPSIATSNRGKKPRFSITGGGNLLLPNGTDKFLLPDGLTFLRLPNYSAENYIQHALLGMYESAAVAGPIDNQIAQELSGMFESAANATVGSSYSQDLVVYDGTNDYLSRGAGLTGAADTDKGVLSFWLNLQGGNGNAQRFINSAANEFWVERRTANTIRIDINDAGGAQAIRAETVGTFTDTTGLMHVLMSWDNAVDNDIGIYIDDVKDTSISIFNHGDNIDWTWTDVNIGADDGGAKKLNAHMGDFYLLGGVTITDGSGNISEANRRKFITAAGEPVDPSSAGLGTPEVLLQGPASNWGTNDGDGGNFTVTGTFTDP